MAWRISLKRRGFSRRSSRMSSVQRRDRLRRERANESGSAVEVCGDVLAEEDVAAWVQEKGSY
jgi:hypothetical protein